MDQYDLLKLVERLKERISDDGAVANIVAAYIGHESMVQQMRFYQAQASATPQPPKE